MRVSSQRRVKFRDMLYIIQGATAKDAVTSISPEILSSSMAQKARKMSVKVEELRILRRHPSIHRSQLPQARRRKWNRICISDK